jgi:hypothetical protein
VSSYGVDPARDFSSQRRIDVTDGAVVRSSSLKAIGAINDQIKGNWWEDARRDGGVDFPYKPQSIKDGDLLVLYGSGTGKVVGVERVRGTGTEVTGTRAGPTG